jgi:type I restriction enzyme, S subunit
MKAGWETKSFSDVLDIKNGRNQKEVESDSGEYPIYGSAGNVMGYTSSFICEAGTTIVGRKGNINSPIYAETRFWNVDTAFGLAAKPGLDSKFLYYYCLSFDFSALNRGTTIPSLVKSELLGISIPLPPLPEQHRIVATLDKAFGGIAKAKAAAEANLQNARAVFESHLQEVFTRRGDEWVEMTLDELGKTQTGSTPKTADQTNYGNFIPFIKPGDFNKDGTLDYARDGLSELGLRQARKIDAGSVLMVCIGATIGKCGYCEQDVTTNQQVNVLTPRKEFLHKFIYFQMLTERFQNSVIFSSGQATLPIINKSKWSALAIAIPSSLEEQKQIVTKLDELAEQTQHLESLYQRKIAALDELKKSLLHQAFSGAL